MTDFFIADMHFGAERLAKSRGFSDAAEMSAAIATAWYARVGVSDTVWVVGDVGDPAVLASLPGTKHLLLGNTDTPARAYRDLDVFASVARSQELVTSAGTWLLIHRPEDAPVGDSRPVIHGHIHAKSWPDPRFVCVSVDQTGWGPIDAEAVSARLQAQRHPTCGQSLLEPAIVD
jgi:calcineurin-like phosphoesterase family protein